MRKASRPRTGGPGRPWSRVECLLLVLVVLGSSLAGLSIYEAAAPVHPASATFSAFQANVKSYTIKHCSAVTSCETAAIATLPYSAGLVFVAANSSTAPSSVASQFSVTWAKERGGASKTYTESYVYEASNISTTGATLEVWVNFSASTTELVSESVRGHR